MGAGLMARFSVPPPAHEIWLTTPEGRRIVLLDNHLGANFWRIANAPGTFALKLPPSFDTSILIQNAKLRPDRLIQFSRAPAGGVLKLWRTYWINLLTIEKEGSQRFLSIQGEDAVGLLRRRIVAAYAGSANATASAVEVDNLMKDVVTDMQSDAIAPTPDAGSRAWANLSVQRDLTAGPVITKDFAWRDVFGLLRDLWEYSRQQGAEVFFDILPSSVTESQALFEFRTSTSQPPGARDLSSLGAVFDADRNNLENPVITYDNRESVNYVYAAGQGEGTNREVQQAYTTVLYLASIWARREGFVDARNETSSTAVLDAARRELTRREPKVIISARFRDTQGFVFGKDWDFGDKVKARIEGQDYTTIIRKTGIFIDAQRNEYLDTRLEQQE